MHTFRAAPWCCCSIDFISFRLSSSARKTACSCFSSQPRISIYPNLIPSLVNEPLGPGGLLILWLDLPSAHQPSTNVATDDALCAPNCGKQIQESEEPKGEAGEDAKDELEPIFVPRTDFTLQLNFDQPHRVCPMRSPMCFFCCMCFKTSSVAGRFED